MEQKTNPMRHLDRLGIPYETHHYEGGALSGAEVARVQGQDPAEVFKTLVTVGAPKSYYVFLVPVTGDLDLKVHGGCSPLCTKRPMRVTIDSSAQGHERIYFSAGKVGYQIEMAVADLPKAMDFKFADIAKPRPEEVR